METHKLLFGKPQWKIAAELGVAPSQLSHWTKGRRIPVARKRRELAEYFGLSDQDDLLGIVDEDFLLQVFQAAKEMA